MYTEEQLLPVSALQHLMFCERQCALIHLENLWQENRLTAEGRILHEKVHEREDESRGDVRISRGLRIRSLDLGLIGMADVVEFHHLPDGQWQPFPVEYKRGKPKPDSCDEIQLCAQAICLEEMLNVSIPAGAIFYGLPRRRMDVEFSSFLRSETKKAATQLHKLIAGGRTPPPVYEKKCENCSLLDLCLPQNVAGDHSAIRYLNKALEEGLPDQQVSEDA